MRGKYSPTVADRYAADQDWFRKNCDPVPEPGEWVELDHEGFDSYGYDKTGLDRDGHDEQFYCNEQFVENEFYDLD